MGGGECIYSACLSTFSVRQRPRVWRSLSFHLWNENVNMIMSMDQTVSLQNLHVKALSSNVTVLEVETLKK